MAAAIVMMSSHVRSLLLGLRARAMAISLQREQHGKRRHMGVMMAMTVATMVMVFVVMGMMMPMMMVMAMMAAITAAGLVFRPTFVQLKRLAHADVVFAHV